MFSLNHVKKRTSPTGLSVLTDHDEPFAAARLQTNQVAQRSLYRKHATFVLHQNKHPFNQEKVLYVNKIGKIRRQPFSLKSFHLFTSGEPSFSQILAVYIFFSLKRVFFFKNSQNEFFRSPISFLVVYQTEFFLTPCISTGA